MASPKAGPWGPHPDPGPRHQRGRGGGQPGQAIPSHPESAGLAGGSPGDTCVPVGHGQTCSFRSSPSPVCVWEGPEVGQLAPAGSGRGAVGRRAWERGGRRRRAPGPPHSPHFGRHRGHGLAPQRPPSGGGSAHGRGGGASPSLRAHPALAASAEEAAPRPGSDSGPGHAWPRRALCASSCTVSRGLGPGATLRPP